MNTYIFYIEGERRVAVSVEEYTLSGAIENIKSIYGVYVLDEADKFTVIKLTNEDNYV